MWNGSMTKVGNIIILYINMIRKQRKNLLDAKMKNP
jgi:hypothetical protein